MVLLPLFVQVGLTFFLLLWAARGSGEKRNDSRFADEFGLPVLFYVLIAIAFPLRRTDLVIVMLSWVFVVTRFAQAGILATSNDSRNRSLAWYAGVLVLLAMWVYFALKILLLL
ncbi:MAG: hypothetical protein GY844_31625 [Bradyrhizobium sp.]|nr:hypothetical protein [Bradyrhizobium sp.]